MKTFTNNGVRVKPELTDDWTINFDMYTNITVSSEKLGLNIMIRMSLVPDFFNKIKKDGIQIIGNKIVGSYLVSSDLVLISDQELALNKSINWVEGGVYQEGTDNPFIYLGEFYIQKPSHLDGKLTSPKKVKIGAYDLADIYDFSGDKYRFKGPEYSTYQYFEIKSNIIPTIKDKADDYGKFVKDIDIKALIQGYLYIGRGLPSKKYTTVDKEAVLYGGHDAIEVELNGREYIVTTHSLLKRGFNTFLSSVLSYVKDEKMENVLGTHRLRGQVLIFEKNNDNPLIVRFIFNIDKDKNAAIDKESITVSSQQDHNLSQDDVYNILLKTKNAEIRALKAI